MTIRSHRLTVLTLPPLLAILLSVFLWRAVGISSAEPTVYGFVALAGNNTEINQTAAPFLADGRLRFVRQYGASSADYARESPLYSGGAFPNQFNIKVYQVQTVTARMNDVVNAVYNAAASHSNVYAEKDIRHLAYMPQQLLVSGPCSEVSQVANGAGLAPYDDNTLPVEMDAQGVCLSIGLYSSYNTKTVAQSIDIVNQYAQGNRLDNVVAQPNQVTMGFPGGHFIFGSPAGMATPGSITPTLPAPIFDGTGNEIAVVLFDTAPYADAPAVSTQIVNGKAISVNQSLPLPTNLPFSGQSVVGSHGTFVATPVTVLAPDSDIFLIRVLSQDAMGTEFLLIEAIQAARDYFLANASSFNGVIFNYSLGVEEAEIPEPNPALSRTLAFVHNTNIFQVAAAGNNSVWSATPENPNLPASHPHVLGVTGIAPGNKLACYANRGDIATWGGGVPRSAPGPCPVDKNVADCAAGARSNCLTGYDPHSPNKWAYGIGTSFASPIVAAMVARRMETLPPPRSELWSDPNEARTEVENAATPDEPELGKGYIGDFGVPTSVTLANVEQVPGQRIGVAILAMLVGISLTGLLFVKEAGKIRP
jgi:hypothetical protein